jgi:drug/metabolite transporter (DMT)-like permease
MLLVVGMLFTGTINTILNKLQDLVCVSNCDAEKSLQHLFEQPLFQTLNMFVGEALCLLVYYIGSLYQKRTTVQAEADENEPLLSNETLEMKGTSNLLLWIPTLCDLTATTLMNVGLIYISASIYQMLRGSVVLFTGIFSTLFLNRKHPNYRWLALFTVFLGVAIVGLAGIVEGSGTEKVPMNSSPIGIGMVILAQVFTASQFVIEERIMLKYSVPAIKAVGLEGLFGLISVGIAIPILHFTYGIHGPPGNFADIVNTFNQVVGHTQIWAAGIGIIFSIAFFNWFGLTVTRNISATSRSTIDTCRTIFIWVISLGLQWETFKYLQVVGFIVLLYGTFLFNDVIKPPPFDIFKEKNESLAGLGVVDDEVAPLLNQNDQENTMPNDTSK